MIVAACSPSLIISAIIPLLSLALLLLALLLRYILLLRLLSGGLITKS